MSERSLAISTQNMIVESLAGWQRQLDRLREKRDKLQEELYAANIEISRHIMHKKNLEQHAASLATAAEDWP